MAALPDDPSATPSAASAPPPRDPSEVALREFVRARRHGDRVAMKDAWRRLLGLEWSRLQGFVKLKRHESLPNGRVAPEDVDDVVIRAYQRLHDWLELEGDSIGEARAIMRNAVHYAVLDHLREHVRHEVHRAGSFDEEDPTGDGPAAFVRRVEEELAERLGDPAADRRLAAAAGDALRALPDRDQEVLVLRLSGFSAKEVAVRMALEPPNVDQIFSRGLRQLRKALKDLR